MNVEHLRLFLRIAATHNISQAGHELGLSPAVSSSYIQKLEKYLGVRLVHRTTRKVSLTDEGRMFLPHAVSVLESIEAAHASVGVGAIEPQGALRVTAPASFARMHLVPVIAEYLKLYPKVTIDLHLSDRIVDLVEGGFDVAIRDAALNDSSLIARKLANDTRIVVASPRYIEQYGEPRHPKELQQHHGVHLPGLESWQFVDENDAVVSIKTASRLRVDNGEAARDACAQGIGVTISSLWCCQEHLNNRTLKRVLKDYPLHNESAIWAVFPSNRQLAPKVRAFIDHLTTSFEGSPIFHP